jgi:hypothetical protein
MDRFLKRKLTLESDKIMLMKAPPEMKGRILMEELQKEMQIQQTPSSNMLKKKVPLMLRGVKLWPDGLSQGF